MAGTVADLGAGAIFGSALLTSGVYSPAVIVSQMRLENFHMLESFLAASAVSAILVAVADQQGISKANIRPSRSIGIIPYDANLIGGLMQGVGMTLTGACPGTVLVQVATGVRTGYFVGLGGLAGGILFSVLGPSLISTSAGSSQSSLQKPESIQGKFNIDGSIVLALYEAMCLGMIAASTSLFPVASYVPDPIIGGLLIGAAQAATLLLTKRTVGVSGGYGDIGAALVNTFKGRFQLASFITPSSTFAVGVLSGAFALAHSGYLTLPRLPEGAVSPGMAAIGGLLGIFGARLAGGCTSGHGISGMATFSLSSFATVAAMFGGGIGAAWLLQ